MYDLCKTFEYQKPTRPTIRLVVCMRACVRYCNVTHIELIKFYLFRTSTDEIFFFPFLVVHWYSMNLSSKINKVPPEMVYWVTWFIYIFVSFAAPHNIPCFRNDFFLHPCRRSFSMFVVVLVWWYRLNKQMWRDFCGRRIDGWLFACKLIHSGYSKTIRNITNVFNDRLVTLLNEFWVKH